MMGEGLRAILSNDYRELGVGNPWARCLYSLKFTSPCVMVFIAGLGGVGFGGDDGPW